VKDIVREDAAVSKIAVLIGIVIVAAVVGGIAYVYQSRPPSLGVSASFVPEDGGTIQTTGSDGCVFTLSLPSHALANEEEITLTPLDDIEGFPLASGIVAAVRMEPDGLRLMCPANLTIELSFPVPDDLVGFLVQSNGEGFHLYPIEADGNEFSFKLMHFTDAGGATVSCEDFKALDVSTWLTQEDRAMQRIAILEAEVERCSLTEGFDPDEVAGALMEIHYDWFFDPGPPWGVQRMLMEAQSDPEGFLMRATSQLNSWYFSLMNNDFRATPDQVPLPSPIDCGHPDGSLCYDLDDVAEAAAAKLFEAFKRAVSRANDRCISGGQNQDDEAFDLIRKACWLACEDYASLYQKYFDVEELVALKTCGIWSLEIEPSSETIKTDETLQLKAFAKDKQGNMIRELDPTEVDWYCSDVTVTTINEHGLVTAVDKGTARIRAEIAQGCCIRYYVAEAQITVTPYPASIVIHPAKATISVDQTVALKVTVYDKDGDELTGYPVEWTIPPGGIVAFDPITQIVTGVSPGTAEITATVDGKSASATITVTTGEVKYRLTWKATVGYCIVADYTWGGEDDPNWSPGWGRWSVDMVFEGYAEIEEVTDDSGNMTYQVTDFWVNGHYEKHHVSWNSWDRWQDHDKMSYVTWYEDIYDMTDNGKNEIKQKIEENFEVLRYPNGSFMKTANPTWYFFPDPTVRYEGLWKWTYSRLYLGPKNTPAPLPLSEYIVDDGAIVLVDYERIDLFPWTPYFCRGILTAEPEPMFIEYDVTTQTFHLEIEQGALEINSYLCVGGSDMPDPHVTIIYSNHSRCACEKENEVSACNGFWVIGYWEINVEIIHEEAGYSSLQSDSNSTASTTALVGEMGSIRNLDHTFITTMILVATTIHLAKRKPKIKPPTPNASLPQLGYELP